MELRRRASTRSANASPSDSPRHHHQRDYFRDGLEHDTPTPRAHKRGGRSKLKDLLAGSPSKWRSLRTRLGPTVAMLGSFFLVLRLGHVPVIALIFLVQMSMVKELFALAVETRKEKDLPWFRLQQWYFYGVATFFSYGRFLKAKLARSVASHATAGSGVASLGLGNVGMFLLAHHSMMSYLGWMCGFVLFVLSLRKRRYVYQFGQFAWTHMIVATVLMQSSCFVANVLEGLIWFVFPVVIVVFNDIAAYLCGFFIGRTPLIKISPKKTWEGFIGAFVLTILAAPFIARAMQTQTWLTCPAPDHLRMWGQNVECDADPLFRMTTNLESALGSLIPHGWIGTFLTRWLGLRTVRASWFQVHAVVFAWLASIIAPFGGLFASGFKRAFKIKDFSDFIPGHGGITDRMDCQMVMAVLSHLYVANFVRMPGMMTVGEVLLKVELVSNEDLLELYVAIGNMCVSRGMRLPSLSASGGGWSVDPPDAGGVGEH